MGLRDQARQDAVRILEDSSGGFGWPIAVTNPDGVTGRLTGYSNDIGKSIDVDTGLAIAGRTASVALHLDSLGEIGFEIPRAVADESLKPWIVRFNDILGKPYTFKVIASMPDRTLGLVTCLLGVYSP